MVNFHSLPPYQQGSYVILIIQFSICIVGTIGSVLLFAVFCRRRFIKLTFSLYMKLLAVCDAYVLINACRKFVYFFFGFNIDTTSLIVCKLDDYSSFVVAGLALWLLTLISVDRYVTIAYPHRFEWLKKVSIQVVIVLGFFVANFILYLVMPLYYQINNISSTQIGINLYVFF
jgi:hypothetical protein